MNFFRRNGSNILLIVVVLLLFIPQIRKPFQVALNRVMAWAPSELPLAEREVLSSYQWLLEDLQGEVHNMEKSRGEVMVLNIWATWCPPCIAEMPSFEKLYRDYQDEVDFYFVSFEEAAVLEQFLAKRNLKLPVFQPLEEAPEDLHSTGLPTTFVVSRSGKIAFRKTGVADWNHPDFRRALEVLIEE